MEQTQEKELFKICDAEESYADKIVIITVPIEQLIKTYKFNKFSEAVAFMLA